MMRMIMRGDIGLLEFDDFSAPGGSSDPLLSKGNSAAPTNENDGGQEILSEGKDRLHLKVFSLRLLDNVVEEGRNLNLKTEFST